MVLIWLVVAFVFGVGEVATTSLFALFLALGALGAGAVALAGQGLIPQVIAFAALSLLGVLGGRPWLHRRLGRRHSVETVSGATALIGEIATVVHVVAGSRRRGHVRILGESWPAVSRDGSTLHRGTLVRVVTIEGSTLVVERTVPLAGVAWPRGRPPPTPA